MYTTTTDAAAAATRPTTATATLRNVLDQLQGLKERAEQRHPDYPSRPGAAVELETTLQQLCVEVERSLADEAREYDRLILDEDARAAALAAGIELSNR